MANTVAHMYACLKVRTPAPTAGPKEFAQSLAPIMNARAKATINDTTMTHRKSWVHPGTYITSMVVMYLRNSFVGYERFEEIRFSHGKKKY